MGMNMEGRLLNRIDREFVGKGRTAVVELLTSYAGPEPARVRWDILELSKGSLENIQKYVQSAQTDYRDVLYWAEYFDNDQLLRGNNPKQFVEDVLAKWRTKKL